MKAPAAVVAGRLVAILLAAAAGGFAVTAAAEQLYKWVDDKGVVNYGSTPPAGAKAKALPADAPGVTVVPASRLPAAQTPVPVEQSGRTESADENAAREAKAQQLREAIARCEAQRHVDCDTNPYQDPYPGYGPDQVIVIQPKRHLKSHQDTSPKPKTKAPSKPVYREGPSETSP